MLIHLAITTTLLATAVTGWAPTGVKVIDGRANAPVAGSDGAGGVFISWLDERSFDTNYGDVFGQHLLRTGEFNPLWPVLGAPIAAEPAPLDELANEVAPGSDGSAFWLWNQRLPADGQRDLMLKRTLADGSLDPAWPSGGIDVIASPMLPRETSMCPDGTGGVFIAWRDRPLEAGAQTTEAIHCQRVLADGTLAPGWPVGGILIQSTFGVLSAPEVLADGAGGAYIKYDHYDWTAPAVRWVRVQRLLADGSIAPGWAGGGNQACTFPSIQSTVDQMLVSDAAGGVYVAWDDMRDTPAGSTNYQGDIYMARLAPDGTRPPGWPDTGLPIHAAPGSQWYPRLCPDGAGGVLAVWRDVPASRARLTRITASGTQAPGWPAGGTVLCTALGFPDNPDIVSDGQGGAFAGWVQEQDLVRAYAQHFRGDGVLAPGWPITGTRLVDLPASAQNVVTIVPGDPGSAIMVWKDRRSDATTTFGSIRAQRLVTDGVVPTQLALQSAEADAERVRLTWWGVGAAEVVLMVERSGDGESWRALGAATATSGEQVSYDDRDIRAGERLAYRLVDASGRVLVAAAWVQVPQRLEFALTGARPNPARLGALTVEMSLAVQGSGTLELLDLAGRRVAWRELGSLAAGRHTIPFPETASLAPGMHWLRLRQGAAVRTTGVVLTR